MTTVLVVDDSRAMRAIARRMLEHLELTVSEAEHGEQALNVCVKGMPDGILLDWNMPVMDGPAFLSALRLLPNGHIPRVVFCTTENDMGKIAEVLNLGANEFIMKPYDIEILQSKLAFVGLVPESL